MDATVTGDPLMAQNSTIMKHKRTYQMEITANSNSGRSKDDPQPRHRQTAALSAWPTVRKPALPRISLNSPARAVSEWFEMTSSGFPLSMYRWANCMKYSPQHQQNLQFGDTNSVAIIYLEREENDSLIICARTCLMLSALAPTAYPGLN